MAEDWLEGGEFQIAGEPAPWERLSEENTTLHRRVSELTQENLDLKSQLAAIQNDIARFEGELERAREDYESQIGFMEAEIKRLKDEVQSLKEGKALLEQSLVEELRRVKGGQGPV